MCVPDCGDVYRQPRILPSIVRTEKHRNIRKFVMLHGRKDKEFINFWCKNGLKTLISKAEEGIVVLL